MNFISTRSRKERSILDDACSETYSLLEAAQSTAPPTLATRLDRLAGYLHKLEIPNSKNDSTIELSRRQRLREILPVVFFPVDRKMMRVGDSAIYMREEQRQNHANWLKKWGVTDIDPSELAAEGIAKISRSILGCDRTISNPGDQILAITASPAATMHLPRNGRDSLYYELNTNPTMVVFDNALSWEDPLNLTVLHELVHVGQVTDFSAELRKDPETTQRIADGHEIDALTLVHDVLQHAYQSRSSRWGGNDAIKQTPAFRDGLRPEVAMRALPANLLT